MTTYSPTTAFSQWSILLVSVAAMLWFLPAACFPPPNFTGFGCNTDADCINMQCRNNICQPTGSNNDASLVDQTKEAPIDQRPDDPKEAPPTEQPKETPADTPPERPDDACRKKKEICGNGTDDNCNGLIDDGCTWGIDSKGTGDEKGLRMVRVRTKGEKRQVIVVGEYTGQMIFGGQMQVAPIRTTQAYIAAFDDADGSFLWVRWISSPRYARAYDLRSTPQGAVYIFGDFSTKLSYINTHDQVKELAPKSLNNSPYNGIFVGKIDHQGRFEWIKAAGASTAYCRTSTSIGRCLGIDATRNKVYAAGTFAGPALFGKTPSGPTKGRDAFVIRLDATTGNFEKFIPFSGQGQDEIQAIAVAPDGNVYALGTCQDSISVSTAAGTRAINDGTFMARIASNGSIEEFARLGDQVNVISAVAYTDGFAMAGAIINTPAYKTKQFAGQTTDANGFRDPLIARFDINGKPKWYQSWRISGNKDTARTVFSPPQQPDLLYVTGTYQGKLTLGDKNYISNGVEGNAFWAQLNAKTGKVLRSGVLTGNGTQLGQDIFVDAVQQLYLVGSFVQGNLQYLGNTLNNNKLSDIFLLRFSLSQ